MQDAIEGKLPGHLLERAMEQLERLEQSEISINREIFDLGREVSELSISMGRFEPVEIALKLNSLGQKIFSLTKPSTPLLQKDLRVLMDRFEGICFRFAFPDAEELRQGSFQNNLVFRMEKKIKEGALNLKESLKSLQGQCRAAEDIFRGKGVLSYSLLSQEVRADIEGRVFEKFPDSSIESLAIDPEDRKIAAAAIMASLSERMMNIDLSGD